MSVMNMEVLQALESLYYLCLIGKEKLRYLWMQLLETDGVISPYDFKST